MSSKVSVTFKFIINSPVKICQHTCEESCTHMHIKKKNQHDFNCCMLLLSVTSSDYRSDVSIITGFPLVLITVWQPCVSSILIC